MNWNPTISGGKELSTPQQTNVVANSFISFFVLRNRWLRFYDDKRPFLVPPCQSLISSTSRREVECKLSYANAVWPTNELRIWKRSRISAAAISAEPESFRWSAINEKSLSLEKRVPAECATDASSIDCRAIYSLHHCKQLSTAERENCFFLPSSSSVVLISPRLVCS